MDKPPVPKFGSFKPKSGAEQPSVEHPKSAKHGDSEMHRTRNEDHRQRRESERRRRSKDREPSHSRFKDSHRHRRHNHQRSPEPEPPIAPDEFENSDTYMVDRRGDVKNFEYGSLHRYSVPAYRRTGYGNIIGLVSSTKINRSESNEKEVSLIIGRENNQTAAGLLTSQQGKPRQHRLRFVTCDPNSAEDMIDRDYIEFRPHRKRRRVSESPVIDAEGLDYRSIDGKAKTSTRPFDDDLSFASDSDSHDIDQDSEMHSRHESATLSKKAKADPMDLEAWLALVEHQAKMVHPGVEMTLLTFSERTTLANLRLSILNEAASYITKDRPGRARLLCAIIEEGSIIWQRNKLAAKWKDALTECSNSILLWTEYLSFIQDNHAAFCYEDCKNAFLQCLQILAKAHNETPSDTRREIEHNQLYVIVRMTAFIRDAGYEELAIGIWQMLLEYSFCMPQELRTASTEERLAAMEDFWESEAPRLGEEGSQGWRQWTKNHSGARRSNRCLSTPTPDSGQPLISFATEESRSLFEFIIPASTEDNEVTADPLRYVMFSDLRSILETTLNGPAAERTLDGFLCFNSLPPLPVGHADNGSLNLQIDSHLSSNAIQYDWGRKQLTSSSDTCKVQSRQECTDTLFEGGFDSFRLRVASQRPSDEQELADFVGRLLDTISTADSAGDNIGEYFLAFKLHMQPAEAAKAAKRLSKRNSSSLRLYNAYALIEAKLGRLDKACGVWSAALQMASSLGQHAEDDAVLLWHSRLLTQLRSEKYGDALHGLLTITDAISSTREVNQSHTSHLVTQKKLEEAFDRMHLAGRHINAALCADLLAWFTYLTSRNDISSTTTTYDKYAKRLSNERTSLVGLELLEQFRASCLKLHVARKKPYQPASIRNDLETALQRFPNNIIILDCYTTVSSQDRLRKIFKEQTSSRAPSTVVQWSFNLAEEVRRAATGNDYSGSTPNTVRASFAKALLGPDSKVRHSPALWMMWLRFEHDFATMKGDSLHKLRQVFLDGLRHLPWVKAWAILGMKHLSEGGMSTAELRQVYETMVERGLRIRVEIEDLL